MNKFILSNSILTLSLVLAGTASAQKIMEPSSLLSTFPTTGAATSEMRGMPPTNDECGSVSPAALAVGASVTFTGTTVDATATGDYVPGSDLDGDGTPSVWHAFTTTECSNVTVSYCNTDPAFGNVWVILTPSCPAGNDYVIASSYDFTTCTDENVTLLYFQLPAGTWYLPVMNDTENANGPYEIQVSAAACGTEYCPAGAASLQYEKISNVTVAGINNSSTSTAGYEDHTAVSGSMNQGMTYNITVTIFDGYASDEVLVWIDLDQDFTFSGDELVYTSAIGVGPHSGTITVPMDATLGATRMRIRLHDTADGANPDPCGNSTYGQVEDYTIVIGVGNPPGNDACGSVTAEELAVGGSITFTGTTVDATADGDYVPGSDLESSGYASVWHAFTTTECSTVTVSYCNTVDPFENIWVILTPSCPADNDYLIATSYEFTTCVSGNATLVYFELPAGTWYLPVMLDPDLANGPYEIEVSASACGTSYCPAGALSTEYEKISNVIVAGINNSSTSMAGYEDHTAVTGMMTTGVGYPFTATIAEGYSSDQILVWIDLDQDFEFSEDELLYTSGLGVGPHSGTITVPTTATLGSTRMRIRLHDTAEGANATPCGNSSYGQVEDYTIEIDFSTDISSTEELTWSVFPNPTEGEFTIRTAGLEGQVRIELFDMTGRIILSEQRMFVDGGEEMLSVGTAAAGTYILRMTTTTATHEMPLMVR